MDATESRRKNVMMRRRFVRRQGFVPDPTRQDATRHLLLSSRLAVDLDEYWDNAAGGPDWRRLMHERGARSADALVVALAESIWSGTLGGVGRLTDEDRAALDEAIGLLQPGTDAQKPPR